MKNQWGWSGFTAHSLKQTALFAGLAVIAANLWNVFTRLGDDGMHHEAAMSRPLLQSCVARLSRHARQGIVTIYTATSEKARETYRAISSFLSKVASASQLSLEERRQRMRACFYLFGNDDMQRILRRRRKIRCAFYEIDVKNAVDM